MRRQFSVPASQRTPRNAVDDETAQGISKALKSLRKLSKTVAAFSQALSDELRILERVYYKHLNSQRVTIPWRKVVEVRRIFNRLLEADLPKLLDSVRGVFYQSEGATPSEKEMKAVWAYLPDTRALEAFVRRIDDIRTLTAKARDVCQLAYSVHAKYLNNVGFLPYTVTMMSLIARLSRISGEEDDACALALAALLDILEYLKPGSSIQHNPSRVEPGRISQVQASAAAGLEEVDLGETISRTDATLAKLEGHSEIHFATTIEAEDEAAASPPPLTLVETTQEVEMNIVVDNIREAKDIGDLHVDVPPKSKKKKKKSKPRDEIDDIFGGF